MISKSTPRRWLKNFQDNENNVKMCKDNVTATVKFPNYKKHCKFYLI